MKKRSVGSIDSAVKANTRAVSAEYCDWNVATPSGKVKWIWLLNTSSGRMKKFQLVTKAKMATVVSAGIESGSSTRQKNPSLLVPSMTAASSSSPGICAHERPQDDDRDRQREGSFGHRDPEHVLEQTEIA